MTTKFDRNRDFERTSATFTASGEFDRPRPRVESVASTRTRTLVLGSSGTARGPLVEALANDDGFEVVGEHANDANVHAICDNKRPDLVVVEASDLAAATRTIESILARSPRPIVVVLPGSAPSHARSDLLDLGVVEVVATPSDSRARELLDVGRIAATIRVAARRRIPR